MTQLIAKIMIFVALQFRVTLAEVRDSPGPSVRSVPAPALIPDSVYLKDGGGNIVSGEKPE